MGPYKDRIRDVHEEAPCGTCGYPLYAGDPCVRNEADEPFCSPACEREAAARQQQSPRQTAQA
jgi:hypothetical protein